jgi:cobalamin biosynthesis Mg chelatase CobN
VLAVLALACFPGLAVAEESSGIQYETDVPTVPSHESSNIPSKNKSGGTGAPSESDSEASSSESPSGAGSGGSGDSGQGGGTPSGQSNQGGGGGGQPSANGSNDAAGGINAAHALPTTSAANQSSDSGSSPLVPILIAIALLAAASIGYFLYRQRRQGPGSPVSSPKAS